MKVDARTALMACAVVLLTACAALPAPIYSDKTLPVPEGYKAWPRYLPDVDRPDVKQVRAIYINSVGYAAVAGQPFPQGTVSVMELYAARENADGTLATDATGRLVRGNLIKVFVMGKGEGWGADLTVPELRNGNWVYAAYLPDLKSAAPDDTNSCRACHLPLAAKDFVPRYDEFFAKRGAK
jgi:hemoglobin